MPHDKYGRDLVVGDKVNVEMTVKDIHSGPEYCNVMLVRQEADEQQLTLLCQAKQVSKLTPETLRVTSSPTIFTEVGEDS
jgi:hypothetical protein